MIDYKLKQGSWYEVEERCVLRLSGPDRVRYLNGQVSNDVSVDLENKAVPACVCSAKGKVEALVWITAETDALIVDGELSQRETLLERLDRYLIADDCEWEDVTGSRRLFHVLDPNLEGKKTTRLFSPGTDLWTTSDTPDFLNESLKLSSKTVEEAELLSLIPKAGYEINGESFPAELGLDKIAVSFEKGCYLGQEVVSRIKSVGRTRGELVLIAADNEISRDSIVRIEDNGEGRTTRKALELQEKIWIAPALLSNKSSKGQQAEIQQVTRLFHNLTTY